MTSLPDWAQSLDLAPHPEGGWFKETWRSEVTIPQAALPDGYPGPRVAGTAILFLLMPGQQSAWHTVRGTEMWLYHRGSPVQLDLGGDGVEPASVTSLLVGPDTPQQIVPPSVWQRARPVGDEASLVGCIVTPGFDFEDFRLEGSHG
ncbi:cupin [Rhodococcoides fascians]|uniref:cupin domain-containing protein n=1 Tax=Rhodococcoides fascians TaxID=1828 RepID=UPI000B9B9F77|nr:cupin domain-containing protein [Rhodococcus fascians]OZE90446.1 cupin [Rhodococcus fascians]OZF19242.1 cupin [Rhodococcus fascians]OZF22563.1 cupin [Rhodococcus fascians]OZF68155.1 cupin [Rhodococcus fascians]OZF71536.1 cupin [Rhodococcus fascians]